MVNVYWVQNVEQNHCEEFMSSPKNWRYGWPKLDIKSRYHQVKVKEKESCKLVKAIES